MTTTRNDWPAVNVQVPQIDTAALAEAIRNAGQVVTELATGAARTMQATSAFGRVYCDNPDGARRALAEMPAADQYAFRMAALAAYELAVEVCADATDGEAGQ